MKDLSMGFVKKILIDLIRRGFWGFMKRFCEQRFTTFKILDRCVLLLEMDRLLEKYFDENLEFFQGFTVAPVLLHSNKMKERGFNQAFLIIRQVAGALKLLLEGGLLGRGKETRDSHRKIQ
jgi:predicted amidophosphoribosyltransferase